MSSYYRATKKSKRVLRKDKGAAGEYALYKELSGLKGPKKFYFNLYLPVGNQYTEIDVLLVNKSGIFVFENKNYSGIVYGDEHIGTWTHFFNQKQKYSFYNPISQNAVHINALSGVLDEYDNIPIYNVIVFSDACKLKIKYNKSSISILHTSEVRDYVASKRRKSMNIDGICETLSLFSSASKTIKKKHIKNIKKKRKS